jgi:hypothetical protein
MKGGNLLLDYAPFIKMLAVVGREQSEGTLGPVLSQGEIDTVNDQVAALRGQIAKAQSEGNSKMANQLFQKEQALLEKMGNESVVGAHGRVV